MISRTAPYLLKLSIIPQAKSFRSELTTLENLAKSRVGSPIVKIVVLSERQGTRKRIVYQLALGTGPPLMMNRRPYDPWRHLTFSLLYVGQDERHVCIPFPSAAGWHTLQKQGGESRCGLKFLCKMSNKSIVRALHHLHMNAVDTCEPSLRMSHAYFATSSWLQSDQGLQTPILSLAKLLAGLISSIALVKGPRSTTRSSLFRKA